MKRKAIAVAAAFCAGVLMVLGASHTVGTQVQAKDEDFRTEGGTLTAYLGTDTFVSVPDSVTAIGERAFAGNTTMKTIELPDGLKSIGYMAFGDCTALTDVTIPDTVTKVAPGAFKGCSALTTVEIGKAVSSWGSGVFNDCTSLAGLILDEENEYLTYYNGALYNGNMTMLYQVLSNRGGENYVMPAEAEKIDTYAFWNLKNVKNVMVSSLVTKIPKSAFSNMGSVENVVLTSTVKSIESKAFSNSENLKQVFVPASVTKLAENAFYKCPNMKILTAKGSEADSYGTENKIPVIYNAELPIDFNDSNVTNQEKPSTTIVVKKEVVVTPATNKETSEEKNTEEESSEEETDSDTYVNPIDVVEEDVVGKTRIVNGQAVVLLDNTSQKVHGIPKGVNPEVVDENLAGEEEETESEASEASASEDEKTVKKETTVTKKQDSTAVKDTSEDEKTDKVENTGDVLGEEENYDDSQMIEERKYYKQQELTTYTIDKKIKSIGRLAFARSGLTKIDIPDGVTEIAYGAFYACENLKEVNIPDSVTDIGNKAFADTPWLQNWLDGKTSDSEEEDFLIVGDGILLAYRGKEKHVTIPETVKQIGPEVFKGHTEIENVDIPKSVTKIGGSAFVGCSSLTGLTGCEGLETVMSGAFRGTQITEEGWQ